MTGERPRLAVIGGGITGLAAAHRLHELQPDWSIVLYEASPRLGGVLQSIRRDGFLIELAADNFIRGPSAPWAEQLCQRIGFADQLIGTNPQFRQGAHFLERSTAAGARGLSVDGPVAAFDDPRVAAAQSCRQIASDARTSHPAAADRIGREPGGVRHTPLGT